MKGPNSVVMLMRERLEAAFSPVELTITDDSARHAGHAGHQPGGETHFSIRIISRAFEGRNRMACHRMIYGALEPWMNNPIHALSIKAGSPNAEISSEK